MEENISGASFLYRHRKVLVIALLLGGILGGAGSYFIPKKYMSTAIIYPYSSHSRNDLLANPQFGYEIESEQLLQLLESKSMRDKTIDKFELYNYYKVDTLEKGWRDIAALKYIGDVDFMRSKYLSIVINVRTTNPQLSADIANYQVQEVNKFREEIFFANRTAEFENVKKEYFKNESKLARIRDSIYLVKGGKQDLLYNFIENLNNENYDPSGFVNDPRLESLIRDYRFELTKNVKLKESYDKMQKLLEDPLPSVYSIDRALPSFKKVSPSYFVNGAIGAFLLFALTLTLRVLVDKWKILKNEHLG